MGSFNFRFEKILDYKETVEDMKKNEYGLIKSKLHEEEKKLEKIYNHKKHIKKERNKLTYSTNIASLKFFNDYIKGMNDSIKEQKRIVKKTREEVDKAKQKLSEAVKEKKIYSKLKENAYNDFLYEQNKLEENLVDNIVSYKAANRG